MFLVNLAITLLAYGAFPFIYARKRNKPITKRKYIWMCIGVNFAISVLFKVLGSPSRGGAFLLWTWVFVATGLKTLEKRGTLTEFDITFVKKASKYAFECKFCGYGQKKAFEICPNCGGQVNKALPANQAPQAEAAKVTFCRKCGAKLAEGSNFCGKCGTEVVRE